jgi:pyruvate ferredoxin oxidoreductase alpha subunit
VIVNLDGFYLSFTREPVAIPEQAAVDRFLPPFETTDIRFRASAPISQAVAVLGGGPYSYFRYQTHLAAQSALEVFPEVCGDFERLFGRHHGLFEACRLEDAEVVFVMMGSFATKAREAVQRLREAGKRAGLLRLRLLRPFPEAAIREALAAVPGVAVIDQNLAPGRGGVLHAELTSALYQAESRPVLASFIGGLGGRDISPEELYEIFEQTRLAAQRGKPPPPRLLYTDTELRELRKLQALAGAERVELGGRP